MEYYIAMLTNKKNNLGLGITNTFFLYTYFNKKK